jgi:hypothetical protein
MVLLRTRAKTTDIMSVAGTQRLHWHSGENSMKSQIEILLEDITCFALIFRLSNSRLRFITGTNNGDTFIAQT